MELRLTTLADVLYPTTPGVNPSLQACSRQCSIRSGGFAPGDEHRYSQFVTAVVVTKQFDQVALFEKNADKKKSSRHGCKQQKPPRPPGAGPQPKYENQGDRGGAQHVKGRRL